jgi:hypothetical protein
LPLKNEAYSRPIRVFCNPCRLTARSRTAVRNLERAAVPRSVAMKVTGHRTESVYRRYAIVSDADLQAASDRLALATIDNLGHNPAIPVEARAASGDNYRARL